MESVSVTSVMTVGIKSWMTKTGKATTESTTQRLTNASTGIIERRQTMCIIAIKPKQQKMFDEQTIRTMFENNPDGAGYMYVYDGKVVIQKGFMTADALIDDINNNGQLEHIYDRHFVLHFRIGTSGKMDALNCHPFPIYDTNATFCRTDIALAHNGILHGYEPRKNSVINDTQVYIQTMLKGLKKGFQYDDGILNLIEHTLGTNKFTFLDETDSLFLLGDFIKDNGYIYSNKSYLPKVAKPVKERKSSFSWLWEYNEDEYDDFWADLDRRYAR